MRPTVSLKISVLYIKKTKQTNKNFYLKHISSLKAWNVTCSIKKKANNRKQENASFQSQISEKVDIVHTFDAKNIFKNWKKFKYFADPS